MKYQNYLLANVDVRTWNSSKPEQKDEIIATQRIDPDSDVSELLSCLQIETIGNDILHVHEFDQGDRTLIDLNSIDKHKFPEYFEIHKIEYLEYNKNESNYLFGNQIQDFSFPESTNQCRLNHFGSISQKLIPWLPFNQIKLFCPLYLKGTLFIDYSKSQSPLYINDHVIEFENYKTNEEQIINYNPISYELKDKVSNYDNELGNIGVPLWVQNLEIPRCPKSNRIMKFMLQINNGNGNFPNDFNYDYAIYFFLDPKSKIIAITIQST